MTLATWDLLWNIPLLIVVFGGLWRGFQTRFDPAKMWPWQMGSAMVWFVNAGFEAVGGDELWVWISAILGSLGVVNWFMTYHMAQCDADAQKELDAARREYFEQFRIDDKK